VPGAYVIGCFYSILISPRLRSRILCIFTVIISIFYMDHIDRIIKMKQEGYKNKDIALSLGISKSTVVRHIPKDLKRKGNYKRNPRIDLTQSERQIIEGEILGDGRLSPPGAESCFIHGGKEYEYTIHLRNKLKRLCEKGANKRYGVSAENITVYETEKKLIIDL